ncbi:hypothetical protein THITH_00240 [Thioalkalivibrio paradoxus ARh 1]|uniref:Uncharacterized protein n=1 Tax=Thioalkalivibrio paradoxus ARh 1 TaxID=713585 RepID=W0DMY3_9GAMM|nr:hypothetical protein THITH_00240 [Thioalkalivibrio paradoxus ARh 1]
MAACGYETEHELRVLCERAAGVPYAKLMHKTRRKQRLYQEAFGPNVRFNRHFTTIRGAANRAKGTATMKGLPGSEPTIRCVMADHDIVEYDISFR